MRRILSSMSALALTIVMSSFAYAQGNLPEIEIDFNGRSASSTGRALDNANIITGLPLTRNVGEDVRTGSDILQITAVSATGSGAGAQLNAATSLTGGFGINSDGSDNAFDFDADFGESVTFSFSQALFIREIDLNGSLIGAGGSPESFEVAGILIDGNNPGDIFSFVDAAAGRPDGLFVAAGDGVLFRAVNGSGNIDTLTVQIASAVPEPSSLLGLMGLAGLLGLKRRR